MCFTLSFDGSLFSPRTVLAMAVSVFQACGVVSVLIVALFGSAAGNKKCCLRTRLGVPVLILSLLTVVLSAKICLGNESSEEPHPKGSTGLQAPWEPLDAPVHQNRRRTQRQVTERDTCPRHAEDSSLFTAKTMRSRCLLRRSTRPHCGAGPRGEMVRNRKTGENNTVARTVDVSDSSQWIKNFM